METGPAASGSALKRQLLAPLAKVNRIRSLWDGALKDAIEGAAALEVAYGVPGAVPLEDVSIEWRDGLPEDPVELAGWLSTLKISGLVSLDRALRLQGLEGDKLATELDEINSERALAAPAAPRVTLQTQTFNNGR